MRRPPVRCAAPFTLFEREGPCPQSPCGGFSFAAGRETAPRPVKGLFPAFFRRVSAGQLKSCPRRRTQSRTPAHNRLPPVTRVRGSRRRFFLWFSPWGGGSSQGAGFGEQPPLCMRGSRPGAGTPCRGSAPCSAGGGSACRRQSQGGLLQDFLKTWRYFGENPYIIHIFLVFLQNVQDPLAKQRRKRYTGYRV